MPFEIVRNDITEMKVDAIVCPTNRMLIGDTGVAKAIHTKAGHSLTLECLRVGPCDVGNAVITKGYELNADYVIHAVGPTYGLNGRTGRGLLISCYQRCLELAMKFNCHSIAIPLISTGAKKYPKFDAILIADRAINDFLESNYLYDLHVYLVVYDEESFKTSMKLYLEVYDYLKEVQGYNYSFTMSISRSDEDCFDKGSLERKIAEKSDIGFSQCLLKMIAASGMEETECYKRANIDRKLFSKIRSNADYRPSKQTVLAFCIALRLSMEQSELLLGKAGFSFSDCDVGDIIVRFFIEKKRYNIRAVNEYLYHYDQKLLGSI